MRTFFPLILRPLAVERSSQARKGQGGMSRVMRAEREVRDGSKGIRGQASLRKQDHNTYSKEAGSQLHCPGAGAPRA